jgi:hypothetical protein
MTPGVIHVTAGMVHVTAGVVHVTAGMVHVTAGMVHVTNPGTPGSECNPTNGSCTSPPPAPSTSPSWCASSAKCKALWSKAHQSMAASMVHVTAGMVRVTNLTSDGGGGGGGGVCCVWSGAVERGLMIFSCLS